MDSVYVNNARPVRKTYTNVKIKRKIHMFFYVFFKRFFDLIASFLLLIILSPFFAAIAIAIKLDSKGPVLYVSDRVGRYGKVFKFYKFRSMFTDADKTYNQLLETNETGGPTFKMKEDPRVTKVGKFIRKFSLDELPQFYNILKGDISFVGPRSPLVREVENYDKRAMRRLNVVGGLTCYWQCRGRSAIDFEGMINLDLQYIKDRGIWTDIKILFKTIPAVLKGDGAY